MQKKIQKDPNISGGEDSGYCEANAQGKGDICEASEPSLSKHSFGVLSQPAGVSSNQTTLFRFSTKDNSQECLNKDKQSCDEVNRQFNMDRNDHSSWKYGTEDVFTNSRGIFDSGKKLESYAEYNSPFVASEVVQQRPIPGANTSVTDTESIPSFDMNSTRFSANDMKHTHPGGETPEVFVFGGSGTKGTSYVSATSHQKGQKGLFGTSSSKLQTSKSDSLRNVLILEEGFAPSTHTVGQQVASASTSNGSSWSNYPLGLVAESSHPESGVGGSLKSSLPSKVLVKESTQSTCGASPATDPSVSELRKPCGVDTLHGQQVQADECRKTVVGDLGVFSTTLTMENEATQFSDESFTTSSNTFKDDESATFSFANTWNTGLDKKPVYMENESYSQLPRFFTDGLAEKSTQSTYFLKDLGSSSSMHEDEPSTGQFSGYFSPMSSVSEGLPLRTDSGSSSGKQQNLSQTFDFQGNLENMNLPPMELKKSRNVRRQNGVKHKARNLKQSTSQKTKDIPLGSSIITDDTFLRSGSTNLNQILSKTNSAKHPEDKNLLRQSPKVENIQEVSIVMDMQNTEGDQGVIEQVNEGGNDWTDWILSGKRNRVGKGRGIDEGPSPCHENFWSPMISGEQTTNLKEVSNYELPFRFGARSSENSSLVHHILPSETFKTLIPGLITNSGDLQSHNQDMKSQPKPKHAFIFPTSDDRSSLSEASGGSTFRNNENYSNVSSEGSNSINTSFTHGLMIASSEGTSELRSATAEQECERWRLRGNQAYADGDFSRAEEYYSRGARSVSLDESSHSCIRALMLCFSSRAVTRIALGRMREALADCKRAIGMDPGFFRVRLRAASCHLALGETEAAANMYKACMEYGNENGTLDSKILSEASEGLEKSQEIDEYSKKVLELLQKETFQDSISALHLLDKALSVSPFSERLHEQKAQVLLSLQRYEECVQLCEQSLVPAECNHGSTVQNCDDSISKEACQRNRNCHLMLWRWRLSAKALYHLGKLEDALDLLIKHEEMLSSCQLHNCISSESLSSFITSIHELLLHKSAGVKAFQLGKYEDAIEHYTAALAQAGDSRPFIAVCFCNRAAASQALGHIADAIADCSCAIAIDATYPNALSQRATLHEAIRDYGQTCYDLRRLVAVLEDYQANRSTQAVKWVGSDADIPDLKHSRERLEKGEEDIKKSHPIDHYMLLGVDFTCSANEVKKAYRKAALKHHPDKAIQFLTRGDNGDKTLPKEVGDQVRRDAERLFKLIGESYAVLSDPTKRLRYDTEEEKRRRKERDSRANTPSSRKGAQHQPARSNV
ncbi:hypothetical protein KP509_07G062600 [Ceratopteris richardii]|uniref:J domain-containing protein n=3 Tax=Ceratopteris richardii TaxID=49495 RepID=A0A8T2UIW1_CERRI|nr:hypothetical protein KP509_07G062600 [Ceratopteris richardii]